jgi:cytochrome c-type biogenesis protein
MEVPFAAALLAGLLSFVSPCVLPLVPAYISFMTGVSVDRLRSEEGGELGLEATMHSLFFVLGFSTVFIALGASATYLGQIMLENMETLSKAGGVLIIIFGLHYMGLFKISFLNMDARFNLQDKPPGLFGAYMIGLSFAFGWTPCVGPILATILTMAGGQDSVWQGVSLLAVYSLGLGIPFILAGVAINSFFSFFVKIREHLHKIEVISGALLVVVGVLIFMGDFSKLAILLIEWFPELATIG